MAALDDFIAATDDTQFRQKVSMTVARVIMDAVNVATPPTQHLNLARKFMLSPGSEVERYLLPIAAQLIIAGVSVSAANDAQILTAAQQVLSANVKLNIGVT